MAEKNAEGKTTEGGDQPVWTPPSQQSPPQYPAIKPGEPVPVDYPDPLRMVPSKAKETKQKTVEGSPPRGKISYPG